MLKINVNMKKEIKLKIKKAENKYKGDRAGPK